MQSPKKWFAQKLVSYLSTVRPDATSIALCTPELLYTTLRKGDVLLVEGNTRFSVAIQYLSQSNWSHSALCIKTPSECTPDEPCLIEADIREGVRLVAVSAHASLPTRICRPVGLSGSDLDAIIDHAHRQLGHRYDLNKVTDLVRYLFPKAPVPSRWRSRMLEFGSSDPTRAICSSLIAQAFLSVNYPILPLINAQQQTQYARNYQEWQRIRRHQLYTPRDFDISPYFQIIKPLALEQHAPADGLI